MSTFSYALHARRGQIEHENRFERSYEPWLAFKTASGNTYRYEVSGAIRAGSSWLTTITVRQGRVVQRDFQPNGCMDDCFTGISIRSITATD
ncbi:hypothetical protein [Parapedobacter composti]|uniref:hypothetical protein n=1 Tax=Parapedobacter composti TaxID=623281 RepID=UPI000B8577B1|nr:hypothetical protein [Parapedobacter composti]